MVSTDAIRSAAKKACSDPGSDLFMVDEHESKSTQALAANRVAKIQWADLTPISRRDFIDWIEAAGHQRKMGAGLQKLVRCW